MSKIDIANRRKEWSNFMTTSEPNSETLAAMEEGDKIIDSGQRRFSLADEMFLELGIL